MQSREVEVYIYVKMKRVSGIDLLTHLLKGMSKVEAKQSALVYELLDLGR